MKWNKFWMGTVIALLLVSAFSMTVFASEVMSGPDEVVEGSDISVEFTSPQGGGMEGTVNASNNLTFQSIGGGNMGSSLSDEHHVFSLFGDPVQYTYNVSASAGEEVWVSLSDIEQSDADNNLSQLDDEEWRQTVSAASPAPTPSSSASSRPTTQPTPTNYPTGDPQPTGQPSLSPTLSPGGPAPSASATIIPGITDDSNNTPPDRPFRYPQGYRPQPVAQRTVYRTSNDGMPKTGDATPENMNYWALLSMAALLGVVVIVSVTQVCAFDDGATRRPVSRGHRYYRR